jgi:hypothetical protein
MGRGDWRFRICVLLLALGAGLIALFPPRTTGDVAAWVQAIGTIGAIVGSFLVAEMQATAAARTAEQAANAAELSKQAKFVAIAAYGLGAADYVRDIIRDEDSISPVVFARSYNRSLVQDAAEALKGIPLHEVGSPEAIAAIAGMRRALFALSALCDRAVEDGFREATKFERQSMHSLVSAIVSVHENYEVLKCSILGTTS